jgi:hypothetical protein
MILAIGACSKPALYGSAMPLNMTPLPPMFAAYFDFDVLATLRGEDCVKRSDMENRLYWTATYNTDRFSDDKLTRAAIAAASYDAVSNLEGVDSFIVTRVIATARDEDTVCAKVYGRGLRLKKYQPPTQKPAPQKPDEEPEAQPE